MSWPRAEQRGPTDLCRVETDRARGVEVRLSASHYFSKPPDDEFPRFLLERRSEPKPPVVQDLLSKIYYVP